MPLYIRRRIRAQAPFLLVLAVVIAVFAYLTVMPGHWRRGVSVMAAALVLAAVLRLVLPSAYAGFLAVRGRWWDAFCYAALGMAILIVDIRLQH
jgi:Protein of unknown function (DUF3017)